MLFCASAWKSNETRSAVINVLNGYAVEIGGCSLIKILFIVDLMSICK